MRRGLLVSLALLASVEIAGAQNPTDAELLSRALNGGSPDQGTTRVSISPNGKALAFASSASNLVPGDTNQTGDIFTVLESNGSVTPQMLVRAADGGLPDGESMEPTVSATHPDGRRFLVAFLSRATNLIAGYENITEVPQAFVSLQPRGETILVSRALGSRDPGNLDLRPCDGLVQSISVAIKGVEPPEIRVAFLSSATNLGAGAPNPNSKLLPFIAVLKRRNGKPGWDVQIRGLPTPDNSQDHSNLLISGDGLSVVYDVPRASASGASLRQVYRAKEGNPTAELVSQYALTNSFEALQPSLSFNGEVVSFLMRNQAGSRTAPVNAFFVRSGDDLTQRPTQANTNSSGVPSDGAIAESFGSDQYYPGARLSPNGFTIAFSDTGTNLAPNGSSLPIYAQSYLKDLVTNQIFRTSAAASRGVATADGGASYSVGLGGSFFNSSSITATFISEAVNLAANNGGEANAYRSTVNFAPPPLTQGAPIDAPPDVRVNGTSVTLRFQPFDPAAVGSLSGPSIAANRVRYNAELKNSSTNDRIQLVTTRNRVTVRKLSPGRYTVRYRASSRPSSGGVVKSKYSPKQTMVIN